MWMCSFFLSLITYQLALCDDCITARSRLPTDYSRNIECLMFVLRADADKISLSVIGAVFVLHILVYVHTLYILHTYILCNTHIRRVSIYLCIYIMIMCVCWLTCVCRPEPDGRGVAPVFGRPASWVFLHSFGIRNKTRKTESKSCYCFFCLCFASSSPRHHHLPHRFQKL